MNAQLSILRHLIFERLNPQVDSSLTAGEIDILKKEIVCIGGRLLDGMNNAIFSTMDHALVMRHIGQLQSECVYLNDVLHSYRDMQPVYQELSAAIQSILKTTLDYISGYNSGYFNQNNRLPESKKQMMLDELKREGLLLTAKLRSRDVTGRLPDLLQASLLAMQEKEQISYHQMSYMRAMVSELIKLLSLGRSRNWERKLAVRLIVLNFNKTSFFTYCINRIAAAVDEEKTWQRQAQLFGWYSKEIKKMAVDGKSSSYSVMRPGLVVLIGSYIATELQYLKENNEKQVKDTFKNRADNYSFRMKVNMPVGAFALHIQLFIALELFPREIKLNVINQFMADHFSTIGTDSFSANSFDKKRTELDNASYKIVDRHLIKMREYLKVRFLGD
jgi:hypothetical protein